MKAFLLIALISAIACNIIGAAMQGIGEYIIEKNADKEDMPEPEIYEAGIKLRNSGGKMMIAYTIVGLIISLIKLIK